MTQKLYSVKLGGSKVDVVVAAGAAIGTDAVHVLLDDANTKTKDDIIKALEVIRQRIVEAKYPLV